MTGGHLRNHLNLGIVRNLYYLSFQVEDDFEPHLITALTTSPPGISEFLSLLLDIYIRHKRSELNPHIARIFMLCTYSRVRLTRLFFHICSDNT